MKRLHLVAGCIGVGILFGMIFNHSTNLVSKVSDLLQANGHPHANHATATPKHQDEGEDHTHEAQASRGHAEHEHGDEHDDETEKIAMAADQIDGSGIAVKPAEAGLISKRLRVPGTIVPDRNRVARVPSKVIGTVAELKKGVGDLVTAGEVIAILDSREVADAKSEYIAAVVNFRLQDTLYAREQKLWDKRVSSEQNLLRSQATHQEAQVRRDVARHKLSALGVSDEAISKLADASQARAALERYEIKAPIGGRIVEQLVDVGTPMGGEGQAHELYAIADLSMVWVELIVSTRDLPQIKEGQRLVIEANDPDDRATGSIIFTSPLLNQETRSARVIASVANSEGLWRPGSFVTAEVAVSDEKADLIIPKAALQTIKGESRVFIRTADGFEARPVTVGDHDGNSVAIISGLKAGDLIATENTFLLKAELGKSEAEHVH